MPDRIKPYSGSSLTRLVALINHDNQTDYVEGVDFTFEHLSTIPLSEGRNTSVRLMPIDESKAPATVRYTRLPLGVVGQLPEAFVLPVQMPELPTNTHAILDRINTALGVDLSLSEVENVDYTDVRLTYPLTALAGSYAWLPSMYRFEAIVPKTLLLETDRAFSSEDDHAFLLEDYDWDGVIPPEEEEPPTGPVGEAGFRFATVNLGEDNAHNVAFIGNGNVVPTGAIVEFSKGELLIELPEGTSYSLIFSLYDVDAQGQPLPQEAQPQYEISEHENLQNLGVGMLTWDMIEGAFDNLVQLQPSLPRGLTILQVNYAPMTNNQPVRLQVRPVGRAEDTLTVEFYAPYVAPPVCAEYDLANLPNTQIPFFTQHPENFTRELSENREIIVRVTDGRVHMTWPSNWGYGENGWLDMHLRRLSFSALDGSDIQESHIVFPGMHPGYLPHAFTRELTREGHLITRSASTGETRRFGWLIMPDNTPIHLPNAPVTEAQTAVDYANVSGLGHVYDEASGAFIYPALPVWINYLDSDVSWSYVSVVPNGTDLPTVTRHQIPQLEALVNELKIHEGTGMPAFNLRITAHQVRLAASPNVSNYGHLFFIANPNVFAIAFVRLTDQHTVHEYKELRLAQSDYVTMTAEGLDLEKLSVFWEKTEQAETLERFYFIRHEQYPVTAHEVSFDAGIKEVFRLAAGEPDGICGYLSAPFRMSRNDSARRDTSLTTGALRINPVETGIDVSQVPIFAFDRIIVANCLTGEWESYSELTNTDCLKNYIGDQGGGWSFPTCVSLGENRYLVTEQLNSQANLANHYWTVLDANPPYHPKG